MCLNKCVAVCLFVSFCVRNTVNGSMRPNSGYLRDSSKIITDILNAVCLFVCLSVSLSVCLSLSLSVLSFSYIFITNAITSKTI